MWCEVTDRDNDTTNVETEMVHESDIIFGCQKGVRELEVGRTVLAALHPRQHCCAPGVVRAMSRDGLLYYVQLHDKMKCQFFISMSSLWCRESLLLCVDIY